MFAQKVFLVTLSLTCLVACSYGSIGHGLLNDAYNSVHDVYGGHHSEAKISDAHWPALDHYGYHIGKPLLVKNYGHLTDLYSALAPKRSFVGVNHAGFHKDCHGHIKFRDESSIGVLAL